MIFQHTGLNTRSKLVIQCRRSGVHTSERDALFAAPVCSLGIAQPGGLLDTTAWPVHGPPGCRCRTQDSGHRGACSPSVRDARPLRRAAPRARHPASRPVHGGTGRQGSHRRSRSPRRRPPEHKANALASSRGDPEATRVTDPEKVLGRGIPGGDGLAQKIDCQRQIRGVPHPCR